MDTIVGGLRKYTARVQQATPAGRDRYVDLLRIVAIGAVVLGHWLVAAVVTGDDGALDGVSVLTVDDWTHWATWVFQVMPVFFLVGGYANAESWRRHASRGEHWADWVHRRSVRLLGPTAAFVAAGVGTVVLARALGADPSLVDRAGWVAGIMLWFLSVYVAVAALTPLTYRLHERFGSRVALALLAPVAAGDIARVATGEPAWAVANFVLGWALVHQLGYLWHEGTLREGGSSPILLAGAGLAGLVLLTVAGPWPIAMVDVPGEPLKNTSPPSMALLALALAQTGVALRLARTGRAWLERPLPWTAVASLNRVVLTLFLWHLAAVVAGAAVAYGTGLFPEPPLLSARWLAWRVPWILLLAAITATLVAAFAPLEKRTGRPLRTRWQAPRAGAALAGIGVPLACLGLVRLTLGGLAGEGPLGVPALGLSAFAAGTAMTFLAGLFGALPSRSGG